MEVQFTRLVSIEKKALSNYQLITIHIENHLGVVMIELLLLLVLQMLLESQMVQTQIDKGQA